MKTYRVPHTSLVVSRLAYGTGMLGTRWHSPDFLARSVRAIHTAYDRGITLFDTADVYAEGKSEAALGELLRRSPGLRDKIVIQSKCGLRSPPGWEPGDPIATSGLCADLSRDHIVSATEESLGRLGTDHLDILLLHCASALVEPEEVAHAFDHLKSNGKVLHFGVCSHTAVQIELLKKYVRQPLVAHQIWLGLAHCAAITESSRFAAPVDYCRLQEIQVQAFSPLKGNSIYGKPVLLTSSDDIDPEAKQLAQLLLEIANRYDATPAAIMLAWLLRHPAGIVPIIGASQPEHIIENCVADRIDLSLEEWQMLFASAARMQDRGQR